VTRSDREHPRYAHEATVTFVLESKPVDGRTSNVSRGGFCADLSRKVKVGTDVEVDLVLVFDEGTTSEPLRLPARIVWCTKLDEAYQVGFAFKPLDAQRTEYLTMFLRYLDDGSSSKRGKAPPLSIDDRFR
jgi:hypothetical protein